MCIRDRALSVDELFEAAVKIFGAERVFKEDNLRTAITYAMEQCTLVNQVSDGISAVTICGSVVTAGEARKIIRDVSGLEEVE